jgi:hypothetical protein
MECVEIVGEWIVTEYECPSGHRITAWSFPSFTDAETFRLRRKEFYRTIGFDKKRNFTLALPKISDAEMKLFEGIINNPEWMSHIRRQFIG